MGTQENSTSEAELYKLTASFYDGLKIRIREYTISNETTKNYMAVPLKKEKYRWSSSDKDAFPKDEEGKVQIDHHMGNLHRATLFMTEVSREEVETYGVNLLKEKMGEWLQSRADYYTRKISEIAAHTGGVNEE